MAASVRSAGRLSLRAAARMAPSCAGWTPRLVHSSAKSTCARSSNRRSAARPPPPASRDEPAIVHRVNRVEAWVAAFRALFDWRWPTRCHARARSRGGPHLHRGPPAPCSRRTASCPASATARTASRRKMSWRWRRGGSSAGRVPPGRQRARYVRERRPAGRGARLNRSTCYFLSCATETCVAAFRSRGESFK